MAGERYVLIYIEDFLQRRRALAAAARAQYVPTTTLRAGNAIVSARRCAVAALLAVAPAEPHAPSPGELDSLYAEASLI